MIRKGLFASTATCTTRDRELERRINARLPRGHVAAYTIVDGDDTRYGLTYSCGIKSKNFERERFELDVGALIKGLGITETDMANTQLPRGWVYDQDDADADPLDDSA
jgi:hypothetical protein